MSFQSGRSVSQIKSLPCVNNYNGQPTYQSSTIQFHFLKTVLFLGTERKNTIERWYAVACLKRTLKEASYSFMFRRITDSFSPLGLNVHVKDNLQLTKIHFKIVQLRSLCCHPRGSNYSGDKTSAKDWERTDLINLCTGGKWDNNVTS